MAQRPPSRPRVAREEDGAPQQSSSPPEPYETCMVQRRRVVDAGWFSGYGEAVDFIEAFASSPQKDEGQKMKFLRCICTLCRTARQHGFSQHLDVFCHSYQLAENIKMLLEEEPVGQLYMAVRIQAMLAIAELSSVQTALEGKETSLLEACFSSVSLIHLIEEVRLHDSYLYMDTLDTMDTMVEKLVLSFPASRLSEELQKILQMLLNLTSSERIGVRVVALERIVTASRLLASNSRLVDEDEDQQPFGRDLNALLCSADIQIPILGQLLGRLLLFRSSKDGTDSPSLNALLHLYEFICNRESSSALRDKAQQPHWKPEAMYLWDLPTTADFILNFAKCLQPWERTDIVLVAIEAMTECSMLDMEAARRMLDVLMRDPGTWLADVPQILTCIQENMGCISTEPARQSVESLLLLLTKQPPMHEPHQVAREEATCCLPGYQAEQAAVDFIEAFASSPQKGTAAISKAPEPASADRGSAAGLLEEQGQRMESFSAGEPQGEAGTARGGAQPSSGCRAVPEDDPGMAAPPHAPAGRRRPSLFRRALRALRRAFRCSCIAGQPEQQSPAAGTGQLPGDGGRP